MHFVPNITDMEPKERTKDTLGKHTVMKSNAQLRFEDQWEVESPPVQVDPIAASSSQTALPPPVSDVVLSRNLDIVLSIQQEVNTVSVRVEQNQINIRRCLRHLELEDDDEEDD
jgi:hypothetical protein